ncbi:MAG: PP2C family protein-serine/threonine phosphatase, partial [Desulfobacterales bacterium]
LSDVDYRETNIKLSSGDRLIFYTDGIVEAVNESNEMFGFERLLEMIEVIEAETAEGMLEEIQENVNRFVGKAEQHDDLTIIVLNTK